MTNDDYGKGIVKAAGKPLTGGGVPSEATMTITLTHDEAVALYNYTQSDEGPNYWETPLDPVARRLLDWYRYEMPI